ncbi:hypothetical protein D3C73_1534720 [compost metagenome]
MECGGLVAVRLEQARKARQFFIDISHRRCPLRRNIEGGIDHELCIRSIPLADHLIEVREIQAVFHQFVQVRRDLLAVDGKP